MGSQPEPVRLIGSSLARALRRDSPGTRIVACARRAETLATVRRLDLADETTDDPAEAASGADLVVIATPLSAYAEIGRMIAPALKEGAIHPPPEARFGMMSTTGI